MNHMDETGHARSARPAVALCMALLGALFFAAMLVQDMGAMSQVELKDLPSGLVFRYVVAMALGGAAAGWSLAGLFGRHGAVGWLLSFLGGVLVALVAGMVGAAAGLAPDLLADGWQGKDMVPILFGLVVIPSALAGQPILLLVWAALIALAHWLARRARA